MNDIAYLMIRLAIGASLFGHGLVRLPKLSAFSLWMVNSFEKSMIPGALVLPFSFALPIIEFLSGILLIAGFLTKGALFTGGLTMVLLILGTCLIENWEALPSQILHVAFIALLLQFQQASNIISLDHLFSEK